MLVWSTQIPVNPGKTSHDLLSVSKKWLIGSPHICWKNAELGEFPQQEAKSFEKDSQVVSIAHYSLEDHEHSGFRFEWVESERRSWKMDVCGWKNQDFFLVGVHLHCELLTAGGQIPRPKKPYIIRQIIEDLGGSYDGPFLVSSSPTYLQEHQVDLAANIIQGETENFLPVIYLSATWQNRPAIDENKISQWCSGMAHVVVEPSRLFSFQVANQVNKNNPYDGAISIVWPRGYGKQTRFFPYQFESNERLAAAIADTIRIALVGRQTERGCTWEHLQEEFAKRRIEDLKKSGAQDLNSYIEAFDSEIEAKDANIRQAEGEINRLRRELARSNEFVRGNHGDFFRTGDEMELYQGEQRDALLYALNLARSSVHENGRILTILDSLIKANSAFGERERLHQEIKRILEGSKNIGSREKKEMEEIGFQFSEDGKHYKIVFRGDDRYTFSMAKTGSDWRGLKNWISKVSNILFR